ncbi:MAG TPA: hypothetical protein HA282_05435 [Nanoarchaeota archaeon]|nr:MAG: hypothetical protein QT01_C0001G0142 [archaeon GW2011_AR6]HIH17568.1 hypothetical protein [Nanoarchaeota archaeon]HIH33905.1 hypothetical protein [Nanoarchaeota archaeon]HIH51110.1 hypothetical protein [Nanoarchaeota archaeon]HIH66624.1 hypothetical protein [Nanoarchaeota archaeon]
MVGEIRLSVDEVVRLVMEAGALQDLDRRMHSEEEISALGKIVSASSDSFTLDDVFQTAEEADVERKYIEMAASIRYPSVEHRLDEINKIGGNPSVGVIIEKYAREIKNELSRVLPLEKFNVDSLSSSQEFKVYRLHEKVKRNFWGRKSTEWESDLLASGFYNNYYDFLRLESYDPAFTKVCGPIIKKVAERFGHKIKATYHYKID